MEKDTQLELIIIFTQTGIQIRPYDENRYYVNVEFLNCTINRMG